MVAHTGSSTREVEAGGLGQGMGYTVSPRLPLNMHGETLSQEPKK